MKFSFFEKDGDELDSIEKVDSEDLQSFESKTKKKAKKLKKEADALSFYVDQSTADFSKEYLDLKVRLHQKIINEINLAALDKIERPQLKKEIDNILGELLKEEKESLNREERDRLSTEIIHELMGFGPLEPLLNDPSVSDILVNSPSEVFVERRGVLEETSVKFKDDEHLLRIIDRIVVGVGRRIDESTPLVDARLPDGSRVNAVIP